jgi:hypothetical protein
MLYTRFIFAMMLVDSPIANAPIIRGRENQPIYLSLKCKIREFSIFII